MAQAKVVKFWRAFLGIATEILMTIFIMAVALGLCWLITKGIK